MVQNSAQPVRVVAFIENYLPGLRGGGSVTSLSSLVESLHPEVTFSIVTRNRDVGSSERYSGLPTGIWTFEGRAQVNYTQPSLLWPITLWRILRDLRPQIVYLNSFFSPSFSFVPLLTTLLHRRLHRLHTPAVLLAPRGEFSPGALRLGKRKKSIFATLFAWSGIARTILWHASTAMEATEIRARIGSDLVILEAPDPGPAPNTGLDSAMNDRETKQPGNLDAIFISRISPKKNLHLVLECLRRVSGVVRLRVFGPIEHISYWKHCEESIATLPANISVMYCGPLRPHEVGPMFATAQAFIFPTAGENFGHVIKESLEAGCIPLISDQTPWSDLQAFGAGWVCSLAQSDSLDVAIQEAIDQDRSAWEAMSERGRQYVSERYDPKTVRGQNLAVFLRAKESPIGSSH